jgi:nucleotide-binding universal stress UspA family protein
MGSASGPIVVGTDGSATAMAAVHAAVALAKARGSTVHLVCAYQPVPARGFGPEATGQYDPCADAEECIAAAAGRVRSEGVEVDTHVMSGGAASALVEVAETIGARTIVVGNKGMTGSRRFLLGSVPNKVSHHAPCDVMIVRTAG